MPPRHKRGPLLQTRKPDVADATAAGALHPLWTALGIAGEMDLYTNDHITVLEAT